MADGDGHSDDNLLEIFISRNVNPTVTHILKDIGCKNKQTIVETLDGDIDEDLLKETRRTVFRWAKLRYEAQLADIGIETMPSLDLIDRKNTCNKSRKNAYANDILDIVYYACEYHEKFPRDVIPTKSEYIDINEYKSKMSDTETSTTGAIINGDLSDREKIYVDRIIECEKTIKELTRKCKNNELELGKLWKYIIGNVQKGKFTIEQTPAVSELTLMPNSGGREKQPVGADQRIGVTNTPNPQTIRREPDPNNPLTPCERDPLTSGRSGPISNAGDTSPTSIAALLASQGAHGVTSENGDKANGNKEQNTSAVQSPHDKNSKASQMPSPYKCLLKVIAV